MDYEIGRCTRKCATTGDEFKPGEAFYSALIAQAADVQRRDYSESSWNGAPEGCLGFWRAVMPDPNAKKVAWAPHDVIIDFFVELQDQPEKADTRYVLALLMVRKHLLRLEETEQIEGAEVMVLYCPKREAEFRVPVVEPTPARATEIQNELEMLLFSAVE